MRISIIVAAALDGAIGKDNQLLWHLPADMAFFKRTTMGYPVIMGRNTFDSLGKPLSGRTNIVITSRPNTLPNDCILASDLESALFSAQKINTDEAFIIGGGSIYLSALSFTNRIYLTKVHANFSDADTFFNILHPEEWILHSSEFRAGDSKNLFDMEFLVFDRIC